MVAFVYIGPPGDLSWTYEHERARKAIASHFGDRVRFDYIENVPEGPDAESVIRQYAIDGSEDFPLVKFEHCAGNKTTANMSIYFGKIKRARYISGIIAGKMTKAAKERAEEAPLRRASTAAKLGTERRVLG
jgi:basic membrane protein A